MRIAYYLLRKRCSHQRGYVHILNGWFVFCANTNNPQSLQLMKVVNSMRRACWCSHRNLYYVRRWCFCSFGCRLVSSRLASCFVQCVSQMKSDLTHWKWSQLQNMTTFLLIFHRHRTRFCWSCCDHKNQVHVIAHKIISFIHSLMPMLVRSFVCWLLVY